MEKNGLNRGRKFCLNFLQMLQKRGLERLFRIKTGKEVIPLEQKLGDKRTQVT